MQGLSVMIKVLFLSCDVASQRVISEPFFGEAASPAQERNK